MNTERQMTIELKIMQNEDKKEDHPTTAQIFFFPYGTQYHEYTYNSKIANC